MYMIRQAQEFMNENHYADISRLHCLLRKMMPKEYHDLIDQIKECQDPHVIFNIHGGNNLIAPNASQAEQKVEEKPADEIKKKIRINLTFFHSITLSMTWRSFLHSGSPEAGAPLANATIRTRSKAVSIFSAMVCR